MRLFFPELSGLVLLSSAFFAVACGSGDGSACDALSACCAKLSGSEAQECSAAISGSGAADAQCAMTLSTLQSQGVCSGSGSSPEGAGEGGSPFYPGEGGVTAPANACSALMTCCSNVPVEGNPMACLTVAMEGTDIACEESLGTYTSDGYCTGGLNPVHFTSDEAGSSAATSCFEVTGAGDDMICQQVIASSDVCSSLAPKYAIGLCPTNSLYGCCVLAESTMTVGSSIVGTCAYSETVAMSLEAGCKAPETWQGTLP